MTDDIKKKIMILRESGLGYKAVARKLSISENTVKSYCRRNNINARSSLHSTDKERSVCMFCGVVINQAEGRKTKKFCSDRCRSKWWNSHPETLNRKAEYNLVCINCGCRFVSYGNAERKYCSHKCYILKRFGGKDDEKQYCL